MKTLADFIREKGILIDHFAAPGSLDRLALDALFDLCFALGESKGIERAAMATRAAWTHAENTK